MKSRYKKAEGKKKLKQSLINAVNQGEHNCGVGGNLKTAETDKSTQDNDISPPPDEPASKDANNSQDVNEENEVEELPRRTSTNINKRPRRV